MRHILIIKNILKLNICFSKFRLKKEGRRMENGGRGGRGLDPDHHRSGVIGGSINDHRLSRHQRSRLW